MKFTFALAMLSLALSVSASGGGGGPDLCKNVPVCTAGRRRSLGLTTLPRAWLNAARGVPALEVGTSVEVAAGEVEG